MHVHAQLHFHRFSIAQTSEITRKVSWKALLTAQTTRPLQRGTAPLGLQFICCGTESRTQGAVPCILRAVASEAPSLRSSAREEDAEQVVTVATKHRAYCRPGTGKAAHKER